jgi:hypothetical protein
MSAETDSIHRTAESVSFLISLSVGSLLIAAGMAANNPAVYLSAAVPVTIMILAFGVTYVWRWSK